MNDINSGINEFRRLQGQLNEALLEGAKSIIELNIAYRRHIMFLRLGGTKSAKWISDHLLRWWLLRFWKG